jgi:DNA-binding response OmpR family regulator
MAFSTQTALETEVEYQPNVVLLDIGLPATVARSGLRRHLVKPVDPQILQEFMVARTKRLSTW